MPDKLRDVTTPGVVEDARRGPACADVDPELFFPIGTDGPALIQTLEAQTVCAGCPVREMCLEMALAAESQPHSRGSYGVFGGLTPDERQAILRQRSADRKAGKPSRLPEPAPDVWVPARAVLDRYDGAPAQRAAMIEATARDGRIRGAVSGSTTEALIRDGWAVRVRCATLRGGGYTELTPEGWTLARALDALDRERMNEPAELSA